MNVVTFGELWLRLNTSGQERFVQAHELGARGTGGEANVAVAVAQGGATFTAVSKVPAHEIGQACVNFLRAYGVNSDAVARGGARLGILYVESGASQRSRKVICDRAHSAFRGVRPADVDWPVVFRGQQWLQITATAPALGPQVLRVRRAGRQTARRRGVTSRGYEMQIVDRIGSGDAFTAGIIFGLLSRWPAQRTIEFAVATACLKHSIRGDFNFVSRTEVAQLAAGGDAGRVQR